MRFRAGKWLRIIGFLGACALLIYIFRDTDPGEIWASLMGLDVIYLIPVIVGLLGMPISRAVRLKYMMEPKRELSVGRVFAVYNVGQLLNIMLPALTGQVGRVILFSRTLAITKTFAFTTVILEILFDGVVLVMMIFAASFLVVMPDWMVRGEVLMMVACLLLLGFFYLALHRHRMSDRRPSWLRRRLPLRVVQEWDNVKTSFLAGLDMLTSRRHLFLTVLLSVLSWLAHALIVLFLLRAFAIDIPFWGAIIILIVNTLAIMVPVSPGNVGTFQLACIVGLGFFGIPKDEALAFSILLHVVELGPVFVLGACSSFSAHVRLREYTGDEVYAETDRLTGEDDQPVPETPATDTPDPEDRAAMRSAVSSVPANPDRSDL
ncbi:MAG TPA: lysylphosphatidylglycerol synthase transmembrane domain-containing protein [Acidobacteriota bacterium]|nr:lysylphosphatidylglycerol synthase transmembrane domain-containing protein [Acidobacteriota bacterium]